MSEGMKAQIKQIFHTMKERIRTSKPAVSKLDYYAYANMAYSDVLAVLDDYACIKKKTLQDLWKEKPQTPKRVMNVNEAWVLAEWQNWIEKVEKVVWFSKLEKPQKC